MWAAKQITILTFKQIKMKNSTWNRGRHSSYCSAAQCLRSKDSPWKTSRGHLFFKIEEVNLVYLKRWRYMTKIFYGLPIWLVQTGPVNIEVVINVEFSGNSKVVIDSASFKQLMNMELKIFLLLKDFKRQQI